MGATSFCKWDASVASPVCAAMASVVCADITAAAGDGLTAEGCKAFSTTCTATKAKDAYVDTDTCANLATGANCYKGTDGMCFDDNSTCTAITSSNCGVVV